MKILHNENRIYTIGHSNHGLKWLFELLWKYQVQVLVDVRSRPYSRHVPHFSKEPFKQETRDQHLTYVFMGKELGGLDVADFDELDADYFSVQVGLTFEF